MKITAIQIAELLGGIVVGNPQEEIDYISKIEEGRRGTITFLGNGKYVHFLATTEASIILISEEFLPKNHLDLPTMIVVPDAHASFNKLLNYYNKHKNNKIGIEDNSYIKDTAILGESVYIGTFTYVGEKSKIGNNTKIYPNSFIGDNVKIGENCIIGPGVKIYEDSVIGNNCVIHAGVVIGSDGFGLQLNPEGYEKVPQLGNVVIEDNVEIGANSTIDKATLGSTIIKKGVKLDNLIQIAHNVEIGENTVIAAQTGIAGSTKIGQWNVIGGQVGIAGHLKIGNKIKIQAQTGINNNIKDGEALYGTPAMDALSYKKSYVYFRKLPEIVQKIEKIEKKIK